jgi:hypothetical protein
VIHANRAGTQYRSRSGLIGDEGRLPPPQTLQTFGRTSPVPPCYRIRGIVLLPEKEKGLGSRSRDALGPEAVEVDRAFKAVRAPKSQCSRELAHQSTESQGDS